MKSKSIKKSMGKFKWMRAFFPAFPSAALLKGRHGNGVFYWMLGLGSVLDASLRPRIWNESQGRRWAEGAAGYSMFVHVRNTLTMLPLGWHSVNSHSIWDGRLARMLCWAYF